MMLNHNHASGFDGLKAKRLVYMAGPESGPTAQEQVDAMAAKPADTADLARALEDASKQAEALGKVMLDRSVGQAPSAPRGDVQIGEVSYADGATQDRVESIIADTQAEIAAAAAPKPRVGIEMADGTVDFGRERTPEQERILNDALAQVESLMGPLQEALATSLAALQSDSTAVEDSGVEAKPVDVAALDQAYARQSEAGNI